MARSLLHTRLLIAVPGALIALSLITLTQFATAAHPDHTARAVSHPSAARPAISSPTFTYTDYSLSNPTNEVAIGDFNNDSNPDIIVSNGSQAGGLYLLLGDGHGGFGLPQRLCYLLWS